MFIDFYVQTSKIEGFEIYLYPQFFLWLLGFKNSLKNRADVIAAVLTGLNKIGKIAAMATMALKVSMSNCL